MLLVAAMVGTARKAASAVRGDVERAVVLRGAGAALETDALAVFSESRFWKARMLAASSTICEAMTSRKPTCSVSVATLTARTSVSTRRALKTTKRTLVGLKSPRKSMAAGAMR